jgi:4-hydroxy-4-methyl-2-oxoglutarate aldolase
MLEDPPLLVVKRAFERVPEALIGALRGAQTGHVVDAMDGRGALDCALKPVDPTNASFAGSALTVEAGPSDNLAIIAALTVAKKGDVLVIACDGFQATAVVGDNVCTMARNAGVVAIVVDGMARDSAGIIEAGLPVFARGVTPNSCVKTGPGRIGLPIVAGGVAVASGDAVMGDRDGAVVVPRALVGDVAARLDHIRRIEGELQAKLRAGLVVPSRITELMASPQVRYVD